MRENPVHDDLIQRDIDGRLSADERVRLAALLESDPEARETHRRLAGLRDMLAGLPKEAPPPQLANEVLRQIRTRRGTSRSAWGLWPGGRVFLGYSYAAAAGAALAILAVHLATGGRAFGPGPLERNAAATIGSNPGGSSGSWLSYRAAEGGLALEIDPPAKGSLDVVLAYDPRSFELLGISNRTGGIARIESGEGQIRWSQERPQRVTVLLAPRQARGARVDVRYSGEGGAAGGGSLDLPGMN